MTLYTDLVAAGAIITSHESDLHVESSIEVRDILRRYPNQARNATFFKDAATGKPNIKVPFAYDPWWEAKREKRHAV